MTPRRPRLPTPAYAHAHAREELDDAQCANCARGGVLPHTMLADAKGHRFCTMECGWSYMYDRARAHSHSHSQQQQQQQQQHAAENTRLQPPALETAEAELRRFRIECANAERVQALLLRRLRKDPKYQRAMRTSSAHSRPPPTPTSTRPPRDNHHHLAPHPHAPEAHALFTFCTLLGDDVSLASR